MSTTAKCPNPSCGRISQRGADPLGRVFRCPRCLTKLRSEPVEPGSGSGWKVVAPRRATIARGPGFGSGSGSGSGGVAVLALPIATLAESGEFLAAGFDVNEPWDEPADEAASDFEWNESSYSVPAMGPPDPSLAGLLAATRRPEPDDRATSDLDLDFDADAPAETEGRGLSRFRILGLLGEGRHARVYRAFDPTLERQVALKLTRDDTHRTPRARERFLGEARALARLRHPGIVSIHEAGRDGDRLYLALDLIEGRGLADVLAEERLSHRRAAEIAADLAEALAHAHGLGIVHRDVKPANVRIDARGGVHLMDFGIALRPDSPAADSRRDPDAITGTPAYLAPELLAGDSAAEAPPTVDQYGLGVVLHEMLRGRPPFEGPAPSVLARASAHDLPALDAADGPGIPRALAEICRKATARGPEDRYPSCQDLAADLRRWLRGERPRAHRRGWFS